MNNTDVKSRMSIVSEKVHRLDPPHWSLDPRSRQELTVGMKKSLILDDFAPDDFARSLDKSAQIDVAVLDFSKAFDRVPHQRLLSKIEYYGVRGNTNRWIASFLRGRCQRVVVDGSSSGPSNVISGVPQGSVLGPLLFLLYINDIGDNLTSTLRLFADDCLLYREITCSEDTIRLQADLDRVHQWSVKWQMEFNIGKGNILNITNASKNTYRHPYSLNNQTIERAVSCPYLGVEINSKLKWDSHINTKTAKAKSLLGLLNRALHQCPQEIKEKAYRTIVRPTVEYASSVWDPHQNYLTRKVESVQRRAARFVTNTPYRYDQPDSMTAIIRDLKWESLESRRKKASLTMLYKIINHTVQVPQEYHPTSDTSKYNTRSSNNSRRFTKYQPRLNAYLHSFFPRTVNLWNSLQNEVVTATTVDQFKSGLATRSPL